MAACDPLTEKGWTSKPLRSVLKSKLLLLPAEDLVAEIPPHQLHLEACDLMVHIVILAPRCY